VWVDVYVYDYVGGLRVLARSFVRCGSAACVGAWVSKNNQCDERVSACNTDVSKTKNDLQSETRHRFSTVTLIKELDIHSTASLWTAERRATPRSLLALDITPAAAAAAAAAAAVGATAATGMVVVVMVVVVVVMVVVVVVVVAVVTVLPLLWPVRVRVAILTVEPDTWRTGTTPRPHMGGGGARSGRARLRLRGRGGGGGGVVTG
jgi:Flp pilus assembly protein TadB